MKVVRFPPNVNVLFQYKTLSIKEKGKFTKTNVLEMRNWKDVIY